MSTPQGWRKHVPEAFSFAGAVIAAALVCWLLDSARLLGPFVASAGVIAATPGPARAQATFTACAAYLCCALAGGIAHALLPTHFALQAALAIGAFLALRALKRAHAPALAMLMLISVQGASSRELAVVLALALATAAGAALGGIVTPATAGRGSSPPVKGTDDGNGRSVEGARK
jgi:hypothetical protein